MTKQSKICKQIKGDTTMKTLKLVFVLLMAMLVFTVPLAAQTTTDNFAVYERANGIALRWNAIAVGVGGSIWSQSIDLTNYDNYAWGTDGIAYGGKATTASGNPNLILDHYVCYGDPAVNANWILNNDSLVVVIATTVFKGSTTRALTTKAPYHKFNLRNFTAGVAVTGFDFGLYFYKRD